MVITIYMNIGRYKYVRKKSAFTVNFTNNIHNWQSGKLMAGCMAIDVKIVGNEL